MKRKCITAFGLTLRYLFLAFIAVVALFPLIYAIASSFKTNAEILAHPEYIFPKEFTFDNYVTALKSKNFNVARMTVNSVIYTVICVAITIINSSMSGYVFARGHFRCKGLIFALFSALLFINMGTITVYPLFSILKHINLNSSLWGLIVVKVFGISVVNIYLVRSYVRTLPTALDEAATIDGCSFIGIFFRIIVPLLKPLLATIGILAFQASWNEYLLPTIFTISDPKQQTLIVGVVALKNSGSGASSWNLMLTGTTIAMLPVLVAYGIGNKYFVKGLAAGAVKG